MSTGFTHHCTILTKLSLSDDALRVKIAEDTFHNQGKMPNNFGMTIPDYNRAFQAIQMIKNEYLLDYTNVEQLGERDYTATDGPMTHGHGGLMTWHQL